MTIGYKNEGKLDVPILFLVFNRPLNTKLVFDSIKKVKPTRLYVACDGPRFDRPIDFDRVSEVRRIATSVDWSCEVKTLFQGQNLGCRRAVGAAVNWFFENEVQGIILEDDCLPHNDFFYYCVDLLRIYKDDRRVWLVTGNNFQDGIKRDNCSYYFSKYNHCWGWATWRDRWKEYDENLTFYSKWSKSEAWLKRNPDFVERSYWARIFEDVCINRIDSWAYPWLATMWFNNGLTATPNVNLVSNIGFGPDSTHTVDQSSDFACIPTQPLGTLSHPINVIQNIAADQYVFDHHFGGRSRRFPRCLYSIPYKYFSIIFRRLKRSVV
jgi:hypothetical protein